MSEKLTIRVGKGWKESERPGEIYIAVPGRWTWCPDNEVARLMYERGIDAIRRKAGLQ